MNWTEFLKIERRKDFNKSEDDIYLDYYNQYLCNEDFENEILNEIEYEAKLDNLENNKARDKKKYHRQYYLKNKESIKKQQKEYCLNNKEKIKEYSNKYYSNNKRKILEYQKEYRLNHKKKIKEYYLENKGKVLKQQREYKCDMLQPLKLCL
jgi:hypothetical protein